ncbi:MAG TPA: PhoU domain-containing protein [Solirubrobacteraceae bacterium]|nr:PhoU domain-containing protein [Solirubrobacteraceae bacterium]
MSQSKLTETVQGLERYTLAALQALIHQLNRAADAVVYGDRQLAHEVLLTTSERRRECQRVQEDLTSALGQHPAPDELRALAALLQIARGAGRLSDECKKIAMVVPQVPDGPRGAIFIDLVDPAARVSVSAIWLAKQSFATRDVDLAHEVLRVDAELRRRSRDIYRAALVADPVTRSSMAAFLAANYLERVGDIATDLAEQTVIAVTGLFWDVTAVPPPDRSAATL